MEYVIKTKTKRTKVLYYEEEPKGLEINPSNKNNTAVIKVNKMILTDPELIHQYISIRLERKFKEIFTKLYKLLQDPDTTEEGVGILLGEVEKFKQIINVKYSKYLESAKKREFLAKIILIEEELKKKYLEIKYIEQLLDTKNYVFEETMSRGRGM